MNDADLARLVCSRAEAVGVSLSVAEAARLAPLLDGLPQMVEVVAAWLRLMTVDDVVRRLGTAPLVPALEVAWSESYALADDATRIVLSAASLFAGAFDVASLARVLDWDVDATLAGVSAARDASWLAQSEAGLVLGRTARSFLATQPRSPELEVRHGRALLERLTKGHAALFGPDGSSAALAMIEALDDVRAAVARAPDAPWALDLVWCLAPALTRFARFTALEALLSGLTPREDRLRLDVLVGNLARVRGRMHEAEAPLNRALSAPGLVGVMAHRALADVRWRLGGDGRALLDTALERAAAAGFDLEVAMCTGLLGRWQVDAGEVQAGIATLEEALRLHRGLGDASYEGVLHVRLMYALHQAGRLEEVVVVGRRALAQSRKAADVWVEVYVLLNLAAVAVEQAEVDKADRLLTQVEALAPFADEARVRAFVAFGRAASGWKQGLDVETELRASSQEAVLLGERVLQAQADALLAAWLWTSHRTAEANAVVAALPDDYAAAVTAAMRGERPMAPLANATLRLLGSLQRTEDAPGEGHA